MVKSMNKLRLGLYKKENGKDTYFLLSKDMDKNKVLYITDINTGWTLKYNCTQKEMLKMLKSWGYKPVKYKLMEIK
jgi:hypothetical protein